MSTSKSYTCTDPACSQFRSAEYYIGRGGRKATIPEEKLDLEHLRENHFRAWGELGWSKYERAQTEINKTGAALAELRARVKTVKPAGTTAPAPTKTTAATEDIIVDPRNHVDGICDAVVAQGNAILKCTDPVRHGKKVCPLHLDAKNIIKM